MIIKITNSSKKNVWTHFWDMHSGGGQKTDYAHIFVNLPYYSAVAWFEEYFDRDPNNITCECCGSDFSINESQSIEQATGFHRGGEYVYRNSEGKIVPQEEGWKRGKGLVKGYSAGYENCKISLKDFNEKKDVLIVEVSI